jgi:hypothetical protein
VYKVRTGLTVKEAVDDIITRSVIELRKAAFGDDADDAKNLSWTRPQAWKVVNDLAKKQEVGRSRAGSQIDDVEGLTVASHRFPTQRCCKTFPSRATRGHCEPWKITI